jgi:hypothetical protein
LYVADYRFVTIWRLHAPIDSVFAEIDDVESWPDWWPNVRRVELLAAGGPDRIGAVYDTGFVGRLPYGLDFQLRVTGREPPTSIVGVATGELEASVSGPCGPRRTGRSSATSGRSGPRLLG